MNWSPSSPDDGVSRRSFLAAGAAAAAVTASGCIDSVRNVVEQAGDNQMTLSITTLPADADRQNVQIARRLEANLEAVGIDVALDMRSPSELLKTVLIDQEFDLYVGRHPADYDPDFLYDALHSTFANERGWQNPFGFANMYFDTLLEEQRRVDGEQRKQRLGSVLHGLAQEKPFEPICFPDERRIARTDGFEGWDEGTLGSRHGYLGLEGDGQLHALATDSRVTRNLNPLSATARERETMIDLLYDSLLSERNGELVPWLAESVEWSATPSETASGDDTNGEKDDANADERGDERRTVSITLREDCRFHDGEPLTASDVAFTYRFLEDTSLGRAPESPASRYRGQVEMVESVETEDDRRLTISLRGETPAGQRALTVPILPKHVWQELIDQWAASGEFSAPQGRWVAVTGEHIPPVGSGPYRYESHTEDEQLVLERYDDHFTLREDVDLGEPVAEGLRFTIEPGSAAAVRRVTDGSGDLTASILDAYALGGIPDSSDITELTAPHRSFYQIGFNVRNAPLSNPHFRRAITQLIDKETIVDEVFYDYATPTATPVADDWVPSSLEWSGEDPVTPFVGSNGRLNVEAAKSAFETAGFRYDDNGRLLGGY
ncbi:extracellular solute-binding protein, family 5 [Natrinema pellirubrum DSM 15624]|uniref:Extracellular solute-binding protein, family 5 n=1 Tax=Natrinema pellirubrum (strain DSM 15624 / CIP 106293 / JCM 10476 / NCIMB 786 / 157) TaxID=797303 RepID=L0JNX1_NATP1|nr:ABC transporter substrate-binding protein [Natrinema pellirubrum]AGB32543.1 extracellular solute-binding protein, family 5 [Natrinema pellirubrum DSM 15624]